MYFTKQVNIQSTRTPMIYTYSLHSQARILVTNVRVKKKKKTVVASWTTRLPFLIRVLWGKVFGTPTPYYPVTFCPGPDRTKNSKFYGPDPGPTRIYFPRPDPTRPDPKIFFKMFPDPGPVSVRSGSGKLGVSGCPTGLYF